MRIARKDWTEVDAFWMDYMKDSDNFQIEDHTDWTRDAFEGCGYILYRKPATLDTFEPFWLNPVWS